MTLQMRCWVRVFVDAVVAGNGIYDLELVCIPDVVWYVPLACLVLHATMVLVLLHPT